MKITSKEYKTHKKRLEEQAKYARKMETCLKDIEDDWGNCPHYWDLRDSYQNLFNISIHQIGSLNLMYKYQEGKQDNTTS